MLEVTCNNEMTFQELSQKVQTNVRAWPSQEISSLKSFSGPRKLFKFTETKKTKLENSEMQKFPLGFRPIIGAPLTPHEMKRDRDPDTGKRFPTIMVMREKKLQDWVIESAGLKRTYHISCRDYLLEPRSWRWITCVVSMFDLIVDKLMLNKSIRPKTHRFITQDTFCVTHFISFTIYNGLVLQSISNFLLNFLTISAIRAVLDKLKAKFSLAKKHPDWDLRGCVWRFGACVSQQGDFESTAQVC